MVDSPAVLGSYSYLRSGYNILPSSVGATCLLALGRPTQPLAAVISFTLSFRQSGQCCPFIISNCTDNDISFAVHVLC